MADPWTLAVSGGLEVANAFMQSSQNKKNREFQAEEKLES